jgi:Zn-dependent protease/predicted transcriptional regulator
LLFSHRIKLFRLFGIDVRLDASWLLLALLVAWTLAEGVFPELAPGLAPQAYWAMAAGGAAGLFASIIFHEMAHALVARRFGIAIRGITLFIFGGVAEMDGEPASARGELLMALAGPLASLLLAGAMLALTAAIGGAERGAVDGVTWYLAIINGVLALFNLIPAFPLDGGRVLRAALWGWYGDILRATRIAAGAGNLFGVALMVLGVIDIVTGHFVSGMWRFLIGMFVRAAAESSYRQTVAERSFSGVSVAQVMTRDPIVLAPEASVAEFVDHVYRHHHRVFPVVRDGTLVGQVGTAQAAAVDRSAWPSVPVAEIALPCREEERVEPSLDAMAALTRMQRTGITRFFVVEQGRLVGILGLRDLLELLSTRSELDGAAGGTPSAGKPRAAFPRWQERPEPTAR